MSPRNTTELLRKLTAITNRNIEVANAFLALPDETLHRRPRPNAWNALECLAHLNHYGDYYLPEIRKQIETTKHKNATATYTSSWLGNKFATGMKPGPESPKISTFKRSNPVNFTPAPARSDIQVFLRQQKDLLELLGMANRVDLTRTKTGTSLSRFIKLRLCDTLRVVIYHNWRHVEQAREAIGQAVVLAVH